MAAASPTPDRSPAAGRWRSSACIALLLGLTIVIYDKKLPWQSADTVTLDAHRIGNQLIIPADVKYDGVLVGRVSSVHSNGRTRR